MTKIILTLIASALVGCGPEAPKEEVVGLRKEFEQASTVQVDTIHLRRGVFRSELISNGKLRAERKSDLRFESVAPVAELLVANGSSIAAGGVVASLDQQAVLLQLDRARQQFNKAKVDLYDVLLGLGYASGDTVHATPEHRRTARLRSGYDMAQIEMRSAQIALDRLVLRAPFAGKVANLKTKQYEQPKGDVFCTIIDDRVFDVEFPVLEGELAFVKLGGAVEVASFVDPSKRMQGTVQSINPMVDDKGQIMITARVPNPGGWIDGANVKVYVSSQIYDKLVVPKSAVVIRDNLQVLFRVGPDGRAMWTYVLIEASNSTSHAVVANTDRSAELNAGDVVVVSGNLNLADNVVVSIADL